MSDERVKAIKVYCEAIIKTIKQYESSETNAVMVMHDVKDYTAWMREIASEILDLNSPTPHFKKERVLNK